MKTAKQRHQERPDLFASDGYEHEDAPADLLESMETGELLPRNFLPPLSDLVLKTPKKTTTIRIDEDVLLWFKSLGKGYQTKINAVLRAYKQAHGPS
jgi:uncharacterized protein (DUF4415 family)